MPCLPAFDKSFTGTAIKAANAEAMNALRQVHQLSSLKKASSPEEHRRKGFAPPCAPLLLTEMGIHQSVGLIEDSEVCDKEEHVDLRKFRSRL